MRSLLRGKVPGEVCIDDEKTGYERDETAIGADPCGQRSALSIPIGLRLPSRAQMATLMVRTDNHLGNAG